MQPRHFVLVLDGEQLEVAACDRVGQLLAVNEPSLIIECLSDEFLVLGCIVLAVVVDEECSPPSDDLIERRVDRFRFVAVECLVELVGIGRRDTAPAERLLVVVDTIEV